MPSRHRRFVIYGFSSRAPRMPERLPSRVGNVLLSVRRKRRGDVTVHHLTTLRRMSGKAAASMTPPARTMRLRRSSYLIDQGVAIRWLPGPRRDGLSGSCSESSASDDSLQARLQTFEHISWNGQMPGNGSFLRSCGERIMSPGWVSRDQMAVDNNPRPIPGTDGEIHSDSSSRFGHPKTIPRKQSI